MLCPGADEVGTADRLPTVSAAQALEDLDADPSLRVSTGLGALDAALARGSTLSDVAESDAAAPDGGGPPGGLLRGQACEIWGPPGAGKTAVG